MNASILTLTHSERIIGGLIGLIVGDACGVPVEFSSRSERDAAPVCGMRGWGTHHQPAGTWSDDGAMALAHVDAFIRHGWNPEAHLEAFCRWYYHGQYSAHGQAFDIGVTTRLALRRYRNDQPLAAIGGAGERDNGNGSLMRMLPVACWWAQSDNAAIVEGAQAASALTHAHPRARLACALYALVCAQLLRGCDGASALARAATAIDPLMPDDEAPHFAPLLSAECLHWPRQQVTSDGYVLSTLIAALWCLHRHGPDVQGCILEAVNLGGDTDTTAAVAGGLSGLQGGLSAINRNWMSLLPRSSELLAQAERFADCCLCYDWAARA